MFVLLVDIFTARAIFESRSRAVKKPYGASLKWNSQLLIRVRTSSPNTFCKPFMFVPAMSVRQPLGLKDSVVTGNSFVSFVNQSPKQRYIFGVFSLSFQE